MFHSYTVKLPICLLLILKCQIIGAAPFRGVKSYEIFINEVVSMVKQELHDRLKTGMYYVRLPESLVSESGDSIQLGEDRWARVFGLTFRFARNGYCNKWRKRGQNTLHCPVKFEDLEIQLPKLDNDTIVYVVHVTIKGMLVFEEDISQMFFQRFIWHVKYEMMDSERKTVNNPPYVYSLKNKSPLGLRAILQTRLINLIEYGEFKDAVISSLRRIPKPKDISGY
uniref:Putative secreted protein n=1 Tax=Ixodes ricinus TaxID=34613 RepID=A0A6B0V4D0_IXORI